MATAFWLCNMPSSVPHVAYPIYSFSIIYNSRGVVG